MSSVLLSQQIKEKALELGFDACGISKIEVLKDEKPRLEEWLDNNFHGEMTYMARNMEKRLDPSQLVEGTQSVISVLLNYYPQQNLHPESYYKISKYALGIDYHYVIKDKLKELMSFIEEQEPGTIMRAFTDSAPVLDKSWAQKSGLGWMGKNTLLLNKKLGSFFFIGEIVVGLELQNDSPLEKSYCGNCTKCIHACPTGALSEGYKMDATKCIAYLNIESKKDIPEELKPKLNNWIFGCDICQDVCPWNSKAKPGSESNFKISDSLALMKKHDWETLDKPKFKKLFKSSPVERSGYKRLKMVIDICSSEKE
jgi:epoxyqueuosine reductase